MNKDIKLKVIGTHSLEGEKETFETICDGKYHLKNEKHYFMYQENTEHGLVKSIIKVQDESMEVIQSGAVNMHLFLEIGKINACTYDTPFGSIPLDIHTKRIDMYIENHHMKVVAEYEMLNHDEVMAYCELLIDGRD